MASTALDALLTRLRDIKSIWIQNLRNNPRNGVMKVQLPGRNKREYPATLALYALCDLAEDAMKQLLSAEELDKFLGAASALESAVIDREYGSVTGDGLNFIPISCKNIFKEASNPRMKAGAYDSEELLGLIGDLYGQIANGLPDALTTAFGRHMDYDPNSRPSKTHSTPLARFCANRPAIASAAAPELIAFAEARCKILSDRIPLPIHMGILDDIVAVIGASGWKQHAPTMLIQKLSVLPKSARSRSYDTFGEVSPDVGLAHVAHVLRVDGSRKLVWVGDEERVKSFQWSYDDEGGEFKHAMLLREGGARILRSGRRGMAMWDVTSLPTHGPDGTRIVGKKMKSVEDSWRDDPEDIELSSGMKPTLIIETTALANIVVAQNQRISAPCGPPNTWVTLRILGHAADINCISTTSGMENPATFVTSASDGGVRLYDTRQPTPEFVVDHGDEKIHAVLYEHIGGQPFIIYGTLKSQQIKVWDVRNRAPLYELAMGNNSVSDLAWDVRDCTRLPLGKIGSHGKEWLDNRDAQFGASGSQASRSEDVEMEDDEGESEDGENYSDDEGNLVGQITPGTWKNDLEWRSTLESIVSFATNSS
ncbi:WD40 repeat-containing protein [Mycena indigotica]|uniref:WD40 repeat-containing protein n=1 Tax=Mycena indigotica TaxID=2126181 RepID=A0A8H6S317_9AGAR|nr:WD40 repeat-containing protein [Mycena indigotica]KAF7291979.1 WD40 repeat-containing protein [Mycena indigotica]